MTDIEQDWNEARTEIAGIKALPDRDKETSKRWSDLENRIDDIEEEIGECVGRCKGCNGLLFSKKAFVDDGDLWHVECHAAQA